MSSRFSEFLPENTASSAIIPDVDVADVVDESVIVFDLSMKVLAWNTEAERLYGWPRHEVIGGRIQEALRCAPAESLAVIQARVREHGFWRGELVRTTKSGGTVVVKAKWSMRRDQAGMPIDIVEVSRDITEFRRSEQAFERMQYQYQNLFQASVASFWELDFSAVAEMLRALRSSEVTDFAEYFREHPEFVRRMIQATRIVDVNERTIAMFGKREEIVASLDPFWPDESLPVFAASVVASIERKPHFSSEAVFLSLEGQRYDALFMVSYPPPLRASSRFLVGIIDITQSRRDRAARERSERRYSDFFHFLPVALLEIEGHGVLKIMNEARAQGVTDFAAHMQEHPELQGRVLQELKIGEANQRAVEIFRGKSAAEFAGTSVARYWTECPAEFRDVMAARYSGQKGYQAVVKMPTHDGTMVDILFCAAFGPITGEEHTSLIGLIDVSDRVKAQNMLAKLQADMAHAARVSILGELTASIAHEVSQPLTAIEANTEASLLWLGHAEPNIAEVRDLCRSTAAEVQRAAEILHRIRAMAVRASPIKATIDVNAMIEDAVLFLRHEITRNAVSIQLQLDATLPPFQGDRVQLQQVMVNLGVNAIQSMAGNGDHARVMSVRTWGTPDGAHLIEVEDTGLGIDPETLEQLFEGFFTTKPRGMGIGLAICRSIIESHGGQISARNRDDSRGAVFTIHLPRDPP